MAFALNARRRLPGHRQMRSRQASATRRGPLRVTALHSDGHYPCISCGRSFPPMQCHRGNCRHIPHFYNLPRGFRRPGCAPRRGREARSRAGFLGPDRRSASHGGREPTYIEPHLRKPRHPGHATCGQDCPTGASPRSTAFSRVLLLASGCNSQAISGFRLGSRPSKPTRSRRAR